MVHPGYETRGARLTVQPVASTKLTSRLTEVRLIRDFLNRIATDPVKYALRVVLILGVTLLLVLVFAPRAGAGPLFTAEFETGKVTLTDEPCGLTAVTNAPKRVTWLEPGGKVVEGCYGLYKLQLATGYVNIIIGYFDDLTLQVIPLAAFRMVRAI